MKERGKQNSGMARRKKTTTEGVKIQFSDLKYERMLASFLFASFAHRRGKSNLALQSKVKSKFLNVKKKERDIERERESKLFFIMICAAVYGYYLFHRKNEFHPNNDIFVVISLSQLISNGFGELWFAFLISFKK